MPKVSICIPAYNQPTNLRRALESVFLQSFKDYEVIITDDSLDNSVSIVADEFGQHTNLRYYKNKTRKDTPENWNEAVRLASGELIKILHHDDWFSDENSLADFVKMLDRNPEVDFGFSPSSLAARTAGCGLSMPRRRHKSSCFAPILECYFKVISSVRQVRRFTGAELNEISTQS